MGTVGEFSAPGHVSRSQAPNSGGAPQLRFDEA